MSLINDLSFMLFGKPILKDGSTGCSHRATNGRFCYFGGIDRRGSAPHMPHVVGQGGYCPICGAAPGQPCDAGLHG